MYKYLSATVLSAALLAPIGLRAGEHDRGRDHRFYDRQGHDYHAWNEREARAYRHWLTEERHERYRDWNRLNRERQAAYWRWRHEHMDWDDVARRTR